MINPFFANVNTKMSRGTRSGEQSGQALGSPLPIQVSGSEVANSCLT